MSTENIWLLFWYTLAILVGGALIGSQLVRGAIRQDAVNHGVGEYVLIEKGPGTEFRWKEAK